MNDPVTGDALVAYLGVSSLYPPLKELLERLDIRPEPLASPSLGYINEALAVGVNFERKQPFGVMYFEPEHVMQPDTQNNELILCEVTFGRAGTSFHERDAELQRHGRWSKGAPADSPVPWPHELRMGDDVESLVHKVGREPYNKAIAHGGFTFYFSMGKGVLLAHLDDRHRLEWLRYFAPGKDTKKEIRTARAKAPVSLPKGRREKIAANTEAFKRSFAASHPEAGPVWDVLINLFTEALLAVPMPCEEYLCHGPIRDFGAAITCRVTDGGLPIDQSMAGDIEAFVRSTCALVKGLDVRTAGKILEAELYLFVD